MTDDEMLALDRCRLEGDRVIPVRVQANDYSYDGWLTVVFLKRSGAWRCVVEDPQGRLFIHNAGQLLTRSDNPA